MKYLYWVQDKGIYHGEKKYQNICIWLGFKKSI